MKKLIFFDVDGTIAYGGHIQETAQKTLEKLKEKGHRVVMSTGRALPAITGPLRDLELDGIIASGGASVIVNDEVIYERSLSTHHKLELIQYFEEKEIVYNVETNDALYVPYGKKKDYLRILEPESSLKHRDPERYAFEMERLHQADLRTRESKSLADLDILKFHYYAADFLYPDGCPLTYQQLEHDLSDRFNCVQLSLGKQFSGGEVNEYGITKREGMRIIEEHYRVSHQDTIAIGDDYNDYEMIAYASIGIAMGNAPDSVKKIADAVTASFDANGFARAFIELGLIEPHEVGLNENF